MCKLVKVILLNVPEDCKQIRLGVTTSTFMNMTHLMDLSQIRRHVNQISGSSIVTVFTVVTVTKLASL